MVRYWYKLTSVAWLCLVKEFWFLLFFGETESFCRRVRSRKLLGYPLKCLVGKDSVWCYETPFLQSILSGWQVVHESTCSVFWISTWWLKRSTKHQGVTLSYPASHCVLFKMLWSISDSSSGTQQFFCMQVALSLCFTFMHQYWNALGPFTT